MEPLEICAVVYLVGCVLMWFRVNRDSPADAEARTDFRENLGFSDQKTNSLLLLFRLIIVLTWPFLVVVFLVVYFTIGRPALRVAKAQLRATVGAKGGFNATDAVRSACRRYLLGEADQGPLAKLPEFAEVDPFISQRNAMHYAQVCFLVGIWLYNRLTGAPDSPIAPLQTDPLWVSNVDHVLDVANTFTCFRPARPVDQPRRLVPSIVAIIDMETTAKYEPFASATDPEDSVRALVIWVNEHLPPNIRP